MTANFGAANGVWRGDSALTTTKRARARREYSLDGVACERCGDPATDRHHKDDNTGNNTPENLAFLCRRCHMLEDGRLDGLAAIGRKPKQKGAELPCANCTRPAKPLRKGRCGACAEYFRRTGAERPLALTRRAG